MKDKNMKKLILTMKLIILFILTLLIENAYTQFTLNVEMRPRLEYRNGYKSLAYKDADASLFVSQRSRLGIQYKTGKLQYAMIIQDVRVWGDEQLYSTTGVHGDDASIDIHKAWIALTLFKNSTIKIGRQEFNYDDQRLLAPRNWNQNGLTYDAILLCYHPELLKIDMALSVNNEKENIFGNEYPSGKIKTLNFLRLEKNLPFHTKLCVLTIASGYTASNTTETLYLRGTYGGNLVYERDKTSAKFTGYYQNGRNKSGDKVSAYLLAVKASQGINRFTFGSGLDYLSGQDGSKQDNEYQKTDHLFDILYGGRHGFYGLMDYFNNIPKSTGNGGLIDWYAQFEVKYLQNNSIRLDYHHFWLQNNVLNPFQTTNPAKLDKHLASEIDISLKHQLISNVILESGFSVAFADKSMKILQGVGKENYYPSHWVWLMLTFKQDILINE